MGIWRDRDTSLAASAFSFCAFPAGGGRHAVLAKEILGGIGSRSRSSLYRSRMARIPLWEPHPALLFSLLQTDFGHTDRLGRHRRNPFAGPVSSVQKMRISAAHQ